MNHGLQIGSGTEAISQSLHLTITGTPYGSSPDNFKPVIESSLSTQVKRSGGAQKQESGMAVWCSCVRSPLIRAAQYTHPVPRRRGTCVFIHGFEMHCLPGIWVTNCASRGAIPVQAIGDIGRSCRGDDIKRQGAASEAYQARECDIHEKEAIKACPGFAPACHGLESRATGYHYPVVPICPVCVNLIDSPWPTSSSVAFLSQK